jgi:hypothetical protein
LIEARHDPELRVETVRYTYTQEQSQESVRGEPKQPRTCPQYRPHDKANHSPARGHGIPSETFTRTRPPHPKKSCGRRQEQDRLDEQSSCNAIMITTLKKRQVYHVSNHGGAPVDPSTALHDRWYDRCVGGEISRSNGRVFDSLTFD